MQRPIKHLKTLEPNSKSSTVSLDPAISPSGPLYNPPSNIEPLKDSMHSANEALRPSSQRAEPGAFQFISPSGLREPCHRLLKTIPIYIVTSKSWKLCRSPSNLGKPPPIPRLHPTRLPSNLRESSHQILKALYPYSPPSNTKKHAGRLLTFMKSASLDPTISLRGLLSSLRESSHQILKVLYPYSPPSSTKKHAGRLLTFMKSASLDPTIQFRAVGTRDMRSPWTMSSLIPSHKYPSPFAM